MTSGYDGSIKFDTKIDDSGLQGQVVSLGNRLRTSFAGLRDFMQGPVAAFKEINQVVQKFKAAIDDLENAWQVQAEASALLGNTLRSTGADAWTTKEHLEGLAASLQKITKYGDETVIRMQSVLLGFRNIQGTNFDRATKSVLDMATVMGMDLTAAAQAVGKALDNPALGLDSLSKQGFKFTEAEKAMMKAMQDAGDIAGAQELIFAELEKTFGGAAEAAGNLDIALKDKLKNSIGDLKEQMGRAISGSGFMIQFRTAIKDIADEWTRALTEHNKYRDAIRKANTGADLTLEEQLAIAKKERDDLIKSQSLLEAQRYGQKKTGFQSEVELLLAAANRKVADLSRKVFQQAQPNTDGGTNAEADAAQKRQDEITKARTEINDAYLNSLENIARQQQAGILTEEEASDAQVAAIRTRISALNDLIYEYKLSEGATVDLRNAEELRLGSILKTKRVEEELKSQGWDASTSSSIALMRQETEDQIAGMKEGAARVAAAEAEQLAIEQQASDAALQLKVDAMQKENAALLEGLNEGAELVRKAEEERLATSSFFDNLQGQEKIDAMNEMNELQIAALKDGVARLDEIQEIENANTIEAMRQENEVQLAGLKEGVSLLEEQSRVKDSILEGENQAVIERMADENNAMLAGLREGVANLESAEAERLSIEQQASDAALQLRIDAGQKETAWQLEALKEGAANIESSEAERLKIEQQASDAALQLRIDSMRKENEAQVAGLQEGVALLEQNAEVVASIEDERLQQTIATMQAENNAMLDGLREGARRLEEQSIVDASLVQNDSDARIAAMQAETEAQVLGLQEGAKRLEDIQQIYDDITNQLATETEPEQKAFLENMLALIETMRSAGASAADISLTIKRATITNDATKAVKEMTESLLWQTEAIKSGEKSSDWQVKKLIEIAEQAGVAKDQIEALKNALKGYADATEEANKKGPFDSFIKEIEADAKDWSDVLKTGLSGVASSISTLREKQKDGVLTWADYADAAESAVDAVLSALAKQLVAMAASSALAGDYVGAMKYALASLAASAVSGVKIFQDYFYRVYKFLKILQPYLEAVGADISGALQGIADYLDLSPAVADATGEYADSLRDANDELKKNRELWTKSTNAANAYASVLSKVKSEVSSFYAALQDIGRDITEILIDGLVSGFSDEDFIYAMQEYITKAVVKASVFTETFMTEVASIGTAIAEGIANGFSADQLQALKDKLAALYQEAAARADVATGLVESVFSYDVGSLNIAGDQIARLHNKEMVLDPGIAEQARMAGIYIGPPKGLTDLDYFGSRAFSPAASPIRITSVGNIILDGEVIGRASWEHGDKFQRSAYGS